MIVRYDEDGMLRRWKELKWLIPTEDTMAGSALVVRVDGSPVDAVARREMRRWYLELLRRGPVELLEVKELARAVKVRSGRGDGEWELELPAGVERVVSVRVKGWPVDALVVTDREDARWLMQTNRYASARCPVALHERGSALVRIIAESAGIPEVESLRGVVDVAGEYAFDEEALEVGVRV